MFDDPRAPFLSGLGVLLCLTGCALRGNNELLESQLRRQEASLRQYQQETARLREELATSQREMDLLRAEAASGSLSLPEEEATHRLAKVSGIVFNSLLTAGQSLDEIPGDERFHAIFYPHDADGEVVKLSGQVEIEALDLSRPANEKTIGRWVYPPERSRQLWLAGFLSSGFQIDEAWKSPPQGRNVLLVARFTTTDGRSFETTHTIPIEPVSSPSTPGQGEHLSTVSRAPRKMPEPARASEIAPASYEVPAESRRVPEPEQWEFEIRPAVKSAASPREKLPTIQPAPSMPPETADASATRPKAETLPAAPPQSVPTTPGFARPFPVPESKPATSSDADIRTSDRWTEETLPVVR